MPSPGLDDMISPEQCAAWLGISVRELHAKSQVSRPEIPAFRVGSQKRFHPRTVLAVLASRAGVSSRIIKETIAA